MCNEDRTTSMGCMYARGLLLCGVCWLNIVCALQNKLESLQYSLNFLSAEVTAIQIISRINLLNSLTALAQFDIESRLSSLSAQEQQKRVALAFFQRVIQLLNEEFNEKAVKPYDATTQSESEMKGFEKNKLVLREGVGAVPIHIYADNIRKNLEAAAPVPILMQKISSLARKYDLDAKGARNACDRYKHMWLDRYAYVISLQPSITWWQYQEIKKAVLDSLRADLKKEEEFFRIAQSLNNIVIYAKKPHDLDQSIVGNRLELGKSIGMFYLEIFKSKYQLSAQALGISIPELPDGAMWERRAENAGENIAQELMDALLKVVNVTEYQKHKNAYQGIQEAAYGQNVHDIIVSDRKVLRTVIDSMRRRVEHLFYDAQFRKDSICTLPPRGIGNSKGTCFLNADLQIWRAITCVRGVNALLQKISVKSANPEFDTELAGQVKEFLVAYDRSASPQELETLLEVIQKSLEKIDNRLSEEMCMLGRTHLVMEILCARITQYPSNIYKAGKVFRSPIGFVSNAEEAKQTFNAEIKRKHEGKNLNEAEEKSIKLLQAAQRSGGYFGMEIARAIGLDNFLGRTQFQWPKILIVSTTRWDEKSKRYVKVADIMSEPAADQVGIYSEVQAKEKIKFRKRLYLKEFGFPAKTPTYYLIGFTAKIPGHSIAIIRHQNKWYSCSNTAITDVSKSMEEVEKKGTLRYFDFGNSQAAIAEILVYQRIDA